MNLLADSALDQF